MDNLKAQQFWVVYIKHNDYDGATTQEGIVTNLEDFAKLAKEKFGIESEPIMDEYGRGSMHYEYSVPKGVKYKEFYSLVAEPTKVIKYEELNCSKEPPKDEVSNDSLNGKILNKTEFISTLANTYKQQLKEITNTSKSIFNKLTDYYNEEYLKTFNSFDDFLNDINGVCEEGGTGKVLFIKQVESNFADFYK